MRSPRAHVFTQPRPRATIRTAAKVSLFDHLVGLTTRDRPIVNIPYTQERNDVAMMLIQRHKASEYYDRAMNELE